MLKIGQQVITAKKQRGTFKTINKTPEQGQYA